MMNIMILYFLLLADTVYTCNYMYMSCGQATLLLGNF